MEVRFKQIPRDFTIGARNDITIEDWGDLHLAPDEQITLLTDEGRRYDLVRKDWGFYATPSINGRLLNEGFKTALVRNDQGRLYVMLVEEGKEGLFENYCKAESQQLLGWLNEGIESLINEGP